MLRFGVTLEQVEVAVTGSNENGTGGYLDRQGPNELLVRSLGRIQSIEDLKKVPVTIREGRPVLLSQVAEVKEGPQVKRGDSSAFVRNGDLRLKIWILPQSTIFNLQSPISLAVLPLSSPSTNNPVRTLAVSPRK